MKTLQSGFSMVELLIIVSFIGILAAIAVSQYGNYKLNAYNTTAKTDLRNGLGAEEAYYSEQTTYLSCSGIADCESLLPGFLGSKNSDGSPACDSYSFLASNQHLVGEASHQFSETSFSYDSLVAGSIVASTP